MEDDFSFHGVNPPFLPPGFLGLRARAPVDSTSSTLAAPPPPPPPLRAPPRLPDGVVEDIFLRIPPEDPARLLRSALTCKRWGRLIADRGFRRRYRERHGRAPMLLGFLANLIDNAGIARFFPVAGAGAFRPERVDRDGYRAHDARHGRVLLNRISDDAPPHDAAAAAALVVWEPTTGDQWPLPLLERPQPVLHWNAAVLCAATAEPCDHLDCHHGHFAVVFVGIDAQQMFSYMYSSEFNVWMEGTTAGIPDEPLHESSPSALARNGLYFMFNDETLMLRYDLATRGMSVVALPYRPDARRLALMVMEDDALGYAEVDYFGRTLRIIAMQEGNGDGWELRILVPLREFLPPRALRCSPDVVAVANDVGVVFLSTTDGLYTLDLNSGNCKRVMSNRFYDIVPYAGFYTPVLKAALATSGEGSSTPASTSA